MWHLSLLLHCSQHTPAVHPVTVSSQSHCQSQNWLEEQLTGSSPAAASPLLALHLLSLPHLLQPAPAAPLVTVTGRVILKVRVRCKTSIQDPSRCCISLTSLASVVAGAALATACSSCSSCLHQAAKVSIQMQCKVSNMLRLALASSSAADRLSSCCCISSTILGSVAAAALVTACFSCSSCDSQGAR